MQLRALRAFGEVVRKGGFSQAAKTVFTTQSTVSKAVRQLEEEIGLPLLHRTGQRNQLTEAGEIVYRRACTMLAELDDLVAEIDELRGLKRGTLRIGLPPIGSDLLFARRFATYRSRYPGVDIQLVEHGSKRLEEMVLAGEIELGVSLLPISERFDWLEVHREPIDVLIASDHPLASKSELEPQLLAKLPFILFETEFALNPVILDVFQHQGISPAIAARSSQISFIMELVAAGLGVGFLPRTLAEQRRRPDVKHLPIAHESMIWNMALIWRRGAFLSHSAKAWLSLAREPPVPI